MSVDPAELHNALAGDIVARLVKPVIANGGGPRDILVLFESVALGLCLFLQRIDALTAEPDAVVDEIAKGVKDRWAEQRALLKRELN